jgi:hypothetical protein
LLAKILYLSIIISMTQTTPNNTTTHVNTAITFAEWEAHRANTDALIRASTGTPEYDRLMEAVKAHHAKLQSSGLSMNTEFNSDDPKAWAEAWFQQIRNQVEHGVHPCYANNLDALIADVFAGDLPWDREGSNAVCAEIKNLPDYEEVTQKWIEIFKRDPFTRGLMEYTDETEAQMIAGAEHKYD